MAGGPRPRAAGHRRGWPSSGSCSVVRGGRLSGAHLRAAGTAPRRVGRLCVQGFRQIRAIPEAGARPVGGRAGRGILRTMMSSAAERCLRVLHLEDSELDHELTHAQLRLIRLQALKLIRVPGAAPHQCKATHEHPESSHRTPFYGPAPPEIP